MSRLASFTLGLALLVGGCVGNPEPPDAEGNQTGITVTGTSTQSITSPNYTLDLVGGALAVSVNASFAVESVAGTVVLKASSVTGNGYYVDRGMLSANPTVAELDTAYSSAGTTSISGPGNVEINASELGLSDANLSAAVYRTIVVQRLVSDVASYQTFRIAFGGL